MLNTPLRLATMANAVLDADGTVLLDTFNRPNAREMLEEAVAKLNLFDELAEAIKRIAEHTDPDSPEENYRADDREGCLDTVFAIAKRLLAKLPEAKP